MRSTPPEILLLNRIDAPRRSITDDREEPPDRRKLEESRRTPVRPPGPRRADLASAAWLGLAVGLLRSAAWLYQKYQNQVSTIGSMRLNRHYPWMIPLSDLAVFGAVRPVGWNSRAGPAQPGSPGRTRGAGGPWRCSCLLLTDPAAAHARLHGPGARGRVAGGPAAGMARPSTSRRWSGRAWCRALGLAGPADRRPPAQSPGRSTGRPRSRRSGGLAERPARRAGHRPGPSLSLYGYGRETTPNLDRPRRAGVKFDQARSTAPWTLPSHASMFTGRWPHELCQVPRAARSTTDPDARRVPGAATATPPAGSSPTPITATPGSAWHAGSPTTRTSTKNLSTSRSPRSSATPRSAGRSVTPARRDQSPLGPTAAKDAARINGDFLAWLRPAAGPAVLRLPELLRRPHPLCPARRRPSVTSAAGPRPPPTSVLTAWQRFEHAVADERHRRRATWPATPTTTASPTSTPQLGRLFDELERRGVLENTLVIVTSDHGEELGEHGLFGHGRSLYRPELHVPLLIVRPGRVAAGRVVAEPVSLRDLPATVVDLLGLADGSPFPGGSLARSGASPGAASGRAPASAPRSCSAKRTSKNAPTARPPGAARWSRSSPRACPTSATPTAARSSIAWPTTPTRRTTSPKRSPSAPPWSGSGHWPALRFLGDQVLDEELHHPVGARSPEWPASGPTWTSKLLPARWRAWIELQVFDGWTLLSAVP